MGKLDEDVDFTIANLERRYKRDIRIAIACIYISVICILINLGLLAATKGMIWLP